MRKLATAVGVFLFFSCLIDICARAKRRDKIEGGEKQNVRQLKPKGWYCYQEEI